MNGSDLNAQIRALYSHKRKTRKWPYRLFTFFIDAAVVNSYEVYTIYKVGYQLTYEKFTEEIAIALINNKLGALDARKITPKLLVTPKDVRYRPKHRIAMLPPKKKQYCNPCRLNKTLRPQTKRKILGETTGNAPKKRRIRAAQTRYICIKC